MIKLKKYLNYKGLVYEPSAIVDLPAEIEKRMIENELAERFVPGMEKAIAKTKQLLEAEKKEQSIEESLEKDGGGKDGAKRTNTKRS